MRFFRNPTFPKSTACPPPSVLGFPISRFPLFPDFPNPPVFRFSEFRPVKSAISGLTPSGRLEEQEEHQL